jgi:4a-hydroxytetrahydrobiopterin dehydratase
LGSIRSQRNRIHIDISVPHQAEARIAAAIAAGGHLVTEPATAPAPPRSGP